MKRPNNLSESLTRIWNVMDAFQRIDIERYCKYHHRRDRNAVKNRFQYRQQLLRLASRTDRGASCLISFADLQAHAN